MELRVATFNVQHGLTASGEVDVDLLARVCRRLGVDVLGMQEVDRHLERTDRVDTVGIVAEECGMTYAFGPAIAIRGGEYGNALLARGEIGAVEVVQLPRPSGREARAALFASVDLDGTSMTVAVTHLSVPAVDSVPQLEAMVRLLSDRPDPQLLLGDLNLAPDAIGILLDVGYAIAGGEPSWPAAAPRKRIDHVITRGLEIISVDTPQTPSSDHRPVVAHVTAPA